MLSKIVQKIAHNISQNIDLKIVQIIVQKIVQKMFQRKLSRRLSKTLSWENYPENYPENWPENCSNNCQGDFQKIDQKLPTYIHFTDFKMYLANDKTNFFPSCFCQSLKSEMFLLCAFSVSYWKCVLRFNFLSKKEIKHQSFLNPSCKVAWVIGIFCSVNENVEIEKWFSNLHHREKKIEAETADTVKYLVGLEIKTVRTVLNSCGIHRLLVCFRADLTIYNSQTFFLPQDIKLWILFMSTLYILLKSYFI